VFQGRNWEGDFRIERADGTEVDVHAINSPLFDDAGNISGLVSLSYDVNAQQLSQVELGRIIAVAHILRDIGQTLVAELDAERVLQTVTGAARKLTGASMATFLGLDPDDGALVVRARSGRGRGESIGKTVPPDEPLFAEALEGDGPVRFDDLSVEPDRIAALDFVLPSRTPPLRSCIVMPVRSRAGQVVGAMVVAHTAAERFASTEESILADIAAQAGIVLDIARLFRAAEVEIDARRRAEEVQRFFAETSAVLSSSLAYPESFEQVGRLCVPFLADLCLIDVAEEQGVRRLAAVHADPNKAALVAELEDRYEPDPYGAHPAARILRGGRPEVSGSMSDDFLRSTTRDARHLEIVKQLEFTSYICVPLEARGRTLGALTLVSSGSGRTFGPSDLVLAEEFARARARQRAAVLGAGPRRPRPAIQLAPAVAPGDWRCEGHCPVPGRGRGQRSRRRLLPRVPSRPGGVVVRDRRRQRQGPRGGRDRRARAPYVARARVARAVAEPATHRATPHIAARRSPRRVLHSVLRTASAQRTG
jgi:GAF domain-containing protein